MMKFRLFLVVLLLHSILPAQVYTSAQALTDYLAQLKASKTDSIIIMRQGCVGCERNYDSNSLSSAKGELIYVLSRHNGKTVMAFIDQYLYKEKGVAAASFFRSVQQQKQMLSQKKDTDPETEEAISHLVPYMFEGLEILLPGFYFTTQINKDKYDRRGNIITSKSWFRTTKYLVAEFYKVLQSIPPDPEE